MVHFAMGFFFKNNSKKKVIDGFKISVNEEHCFDCDSKDALQGFLIWGCVFIYLIIIPKKKVLNMFNILPPGAIFCRKKQRTSYIQSVYDSHNNIIPVLKYDFTITDTTLSNISTSSIDRRYEIELGLLFRVCIYYFIEFIRICGKQK